jgi:hypothetical protein
MRKKSLGQAPYNEQSQYKPAEIHFDMEAEKLKKGYSFSKHLIL